MPSNPDWINGEFRFAVALLAACALHAAVILGIDLPAPSDSLGTRALDIRLTVASPPEPFADPSRDPLSPSDREEPAVSVPDTGQRGAGETGLAPDVTPAAVSQPQAATTQQPEAHPGASAAIDGQSQRQSPPPDVKATPAAGNNNLDYSELAKEIANAYALRERAETLEAGGIRTKRLTNTSAKSPAEAAYLDMWRQKVERIGRANYPPGRLSGELLLLAVIHRDGALLEVKILESSRQPALDAAAMRTVRLAAPFSHFPSEMRKSYDRLEIVRRWRFERQGAFLH